MGRVEARYADWRIGVLARWAQLWIDRNFALDYTLKSLEKIVDGQPCQVVRDLRRVLKNAAYSLLGAMIEALGATDTLTDDRQELEVGCGAAAEALIRALHAGMEPAIAAVEAELPAAHRGLLRRQHDHWLCTRTSPLTNAPDPSVTCP